MESWVKPKQTPYCVKTPAEDDDRFKKASARKGPEFPSDQ